MIGSYDVRQDTSVFEISETESESFDKTLTEDNDMPHYLASAQKSQRFD